VNDLAPEKNALSESTSDCLVLLVELAMTRANCTEYHDNGAGACDDETNTTHGPSDRTILLRVMPRQPKGSFSPSAMRKSMERTCIALLRSRVDSSDLR
jgi:hypothetical protein